jgi:putative FmdB family regulatory protein
MAIYEYHCGDDGAFDVSAPLGAPPASASCPVCNGEGRRVFTKPMLSLAPRGLVAAIDNAEKSRHEPEVVTSLPPAPAHKRTPVLPLTPTLRRLPRP